VLALSALLGRQFLRVVRLLYSKSLGVATGFFQALRLHKESQFADKIAWHDPIR
jgi:hypothetical protein